ncbi:hypothetical protein RJT34_22550 [Clitoria ternatea]|uniref:Cyclotide n=1 Tax=Clitoria ternatea TaxID=43366 RepID=A0AAN9FKA2_CLITE
MGKFLVGFMLPSLLLSDKGVLDETYTAESVALIQIFGTSIHNNKAVQGDALFSLGMGINPPLSSNSLQLKLLGF